MIKLEKTSMPHQLLSETRHCTAFEGTILLQGATERVLVLEAATFYAALNLCSPQNSPLR